MDKSVTRETPLAMPRRFAIRLLHEAQLAGEHPFLGVVGAAAKPDLYVPLVGPATLERSQGKAKRVIDLRPKD